MLASRHAPSSSSGGESGRALPKAAAKVEMSPGSSERTKAFRLCLLKGMSNVGAGSDAAPADAAPADAAAAGVAVSVWGGNGTAVSPVSKAVVLLEEDVMFCDDIST